MTSPKFSLEEIVFAKLRGWPAWPAKVEFFENIGSTNKIKYNVYFYGTNQIAQCREEELFSYTRYRNKFGKPKRAVGFMKAIAQADAEVGLSPKGRDRDSSITEHSDSSDIDYLKSELEILNIDKGIINSLNLVKPQLDACLKLLDKYSKTNLIPLTFKKHPQLIDTLLKLQVYSFESVLQTDEDKEKIHTIRKQAHHVYHKVQTVFDTPQGTPFLELFVKILSEFQKQVGNMSELELLQLSEDPTKSIL